MTTRLIDCGLIALATLGALWLLQPLDALIGPVASTALWLAGLWVLLLVVERRKPPIEPADKSARRARETQPAADRTLHLRRPQCPLRRARS